jgi:hypothetical protein
MTSSRRDADTGDRAVYLAASADSALSEAAPLCAQSARSQGLFGARVLSSDIGRLVLDGWAKLCLATPQTSLTE